MTAPANSSSAATPVDISQFIHNHGVDLSWQDDFYTWMHQHPELSGEEEHTAQHILQRLSVMDCEVTSSIGGYGITAVFHNGPGPVVLMRADFDALPVQEITGVDYASLNEGVMHACGHDVHTSALIGLCAVLNERRDRWAGTFIALFQPAEENTTGAAAMVADDLAGKIPTPDVCLGQHILPGAPGTISSKPGPLLAACDTITVELTGRTAHGSAPHLSIDPTYLASMIVVRLQGIVGREIAPSEFGVISVGTLSSGHSNNTIPDTATLVLNCRFYDTAVRDRTYAAIERVIHGECAASGVTVPPKISYSAHGEPTESDTQIFEHIRPVFDATFGESSVDAEPWTASEDFSEIPRHFGVPYMFWFVHTTPPELWEKHCADPQVEIPGNHHGAFAPDRNSINVATQAGLAAVLSYLFA